MFHEYEYSLFYKEEKEGRETWSTKLPPENDWDFESMAAKIVKDYENDGEYIRTNSVEVYIWDSKDEYIGMFTVSIENERVYHANKVRE